MIRRIDYYLHNKVMPLSFAEPNAYAPREVWQRQVRTTPEERAGAKQMWEHIRDRAYWDDKETIVNTSPVVFIGADNKGTDQVLAKPGGANRDSHGSYPFPGLYTDIGPGGATVADVALLSRLVKPHGLGVKASGGIRSRAVLQQMVEAGATRIGTSRGVQILQETNG